MSENGTKGLERFRLDGRVIVVTGGVGILGSVYCRALAEAGADVVIADMEAAACESLAAEIRGASGTRTMAAPVDLASEESVVAWARRILDGHGHVDVLVNNAATRSPNIFAPLEKFPLADWEQVMRVNVTGAFLATRELGPSMAARGRGSIINVSSIYGLVGPDNRIYEGSYYDDLGSAINTPFIYSASKGALISMTRYLATYWGAQGVRANTLTPGGVRSGQNEAFVQKYSERVPLGRMAESDDMIGALLFLASDASSYVNGQNLVVDGGWTAW
jgi:NAD(P)-dependent dehydrogenase (short-subunit alcohol dehydrogenase family)